MLKHLQFQLATFERYSVGLVNFDKENQKLMATIEEYQH